MSFDILPTVVSVAMITLTAVLLKGWFARKNYPPGPPFVLPVLGNLMQIGWQPHLKFIDWAEQYGSVFRVWMGSQYAIVLNDYDIIKEVCRREEFGGRPQLKLLEMIDLSTGEVQCPVAQ